jgi:group I intron endonuclease
VVKHLKNPTPLYKAIYEIYYKNKVNDLVLRVVGAERVSGIYKITHIDSGKCYVGQSVDIGDRWKQHIKRGVGAEPLTNNKLYPAMMELGVQNFIFEIAETTTDVDRLSEMEKYWQEFYKAKEFGYSIK